MQFSTLFVSIVLATTTAYVSAGPVSLFRRAIDASQAAANGKAAQLLNQGFANLTVNSTCNPGDNACVNGGFAQCVGNSFVLEGCPPQTQCFGLPLVNDNGTTLACTTAEDAQARFDDSGVSGGPFGNDTSSSN